MLKSFRKKTVVSCTVFSWSERGKQQKTSVLVIILLVFVSMIDSLCEYYSAGCSSRRMYLIYTASLLPPQSMLDIMKPTILDPLGRINLSPRQ